MPIYPISFSIPESKIVQSVPSKTKQLATIVPGDPSTYVFSNEARYYADYQTSVFGKTCKKAGWDCMRHYEILANGCIPDFENLNECPPATMTHFPKFLVTNARKSSTPESYIPRLLDYTRKHLTTRAMAQYIFDTVGVSNPKKVAFLSGDPWSDYLRDLTLIGMKEILGTNCVAEIDVPFLYTDWIGDANHLWGKGFSYTRVLPPSSRSVLNLDELLHGDFDLIVYGSIHRGMPYWETVKHVYRPEQIVCLCGEDIGVGPHYQPCTIPIFDSMGCNCFVREL